MGIKEVIANIRIINKALNDCKTDINKFKPDVVILIDYPNLISVK